MVNLLKILVYPINRYTNIPIYRVCCPEKYTKSKLSPAKLSNKIFFMQIGGLEKLSLIDYPGKLSAIVFTLGCNFRCHFCHNPMLVKPSEVEQFVNKRKDEGRALVSERDLFDFLANRVGKLDGVVVTGGEPTIHKDLPRFLEKIKKQGFSVKLDSNGTNPEMLEKLLSENLVDYLAMDLKADKENYSYVTGADVSLENIEKSVNILLRGKVPYEFRTTAVPGLVDIKKIENMGRLIKGAEIWYLQNFEAEKDLVNKDFEKIKPFSQKEMEEFKERAAGFVKKCKIR